MRDDKLKNESWDRFLPTIPHKNTSKRKQPMKKRSKKEYTPFPPAQPESKVDKLLATGEYFLKEDERKERKQHQNHEKQEEAKVRRMEKRESAFVPPEEPVAGSSKSSAPSDKMDLDQLKNKIRKGQTKRKRN